jgi:hypothetical protein
MGNALHIPNNAPSYQCYSTDLVAGKVPNAGYKGADLYMIDTCQWYRVLDDLTLAPLVYTISSGVSGSASGSSIGTAGGIVLGASENHIGEIGGKTTRSSFEIINTSGSGTAYTIGDTVSGSSVTTPYELANILRVNGGSGLITQLNIEADKASITPTFRVHFYSGSSITLSGDNLPYLDSYADVNSKLVTFDTSAMISSTNTSGSCSSSMNDVRKSVVGSANSKSLWVGLETLAAFTPKAVSQKYTISVTIMND